MSSSAEGPDAGSGPKLPKTFRAFAAKFPGIAQAHEQVARVAEQAGPLDRKTCELIKIGISFGAGLESAVKSHVRRAWSTAPGGRNRAGHSSRRQHARFSRERCRLGLGLGTDPARSRRGKDAGRRRKSASDPDIGESAKPSA